MISVTKSMEDTIVALATSPGVQGAIAVIRISGKEAIAITNQLFKGKNLLEVPSHTLHFGTIRDGNEIIDEVLVSVFVGPNSYTRENSIEISTHNSSYIIERIITLFIRHGARAAQAGEFTMRAFLNGGLDLAQAEAVADLIASENRASHDIAMNQMRGGISNKLQEMRERLIQFTALLELELDFSEEDVEFADRSQFELLIDELKTHISKLIQSFAFGNAIKNGVPVAIIGKPNAGKSTLLNSLLDEERAIVSDIAGTTRDTIEEAINIEGITFRFIDTAGLRETEDEIEAIGVVKAKEKAQQAKILLYLYDHFANTFEEVVAQVMDFQREGLTIILVHNKMDLLQADSENNMDVQLKEALMPNLIQAIVPLSANDPQAVHELKMKLVETVGGQHYTDQQIITNTRHLEALQLALEALNQVSFGLDSGISGDLLAHQVRTALRYISSITGEIDIDQDILGTIFSKFCIGK